MNALRVLRLARVAVRPQTQRLSFAHLRAGPAGFRGANSFRSYSSSTSATTNGVELEPEQPKLSLTFTCIVPDCGERSSHMFTKHAYQKGIVIIKCPGCENRHLIADNLGWFKDDRTEEGVLRNIEDMMRIKGENVKKGRLDAGGVVEYTE